MTQIKLRRDTSANFTSKNPVLGAGEPAYETDTKKLKIGDGTTTYTQLPYFSSGGSSSDITATLPIKIVDGVISLEVDGQTIQIVDGKLHANLDELGNEVNDLSGRVTAVEADVLNKQDSIVSEKPLVLSKQVIKNYKGMTITDSKVSSTGGQNFTATNVSTFTINAGNAAPPVSYIEMPYKSGQVIQVPTNVWNDANGKLGLFFGSWQADGNFLVTAAFTPEDGTEVGIGCFGGLFNDGPIAMPSVETTPAIKNYNGVSEKANKNILLVPDGNSYFQILMSNDSWAIQLYASGLSDNSVKASTWVIYDNNIGTTKFDTITPKTNTCLIMMNSSSLKVPSESIGLYDWGTRLQWTQAGYQNFLANKGANLFSLEEQGKNDSLSLTIGDGLSVVDGALTANTGTVDAYTKEQTNALLDTKQDKIVTLTQEAYDALTEKDPETIYMIEGETQDANVDLSNLSNLGKAQIANLSMPSDKYTDLTLGASGSVYTAPSDGWYYLKYNSTGNTCSVVMEIRPNNGAILYGCNNGISGATHNPQTTLFVRKGSTIRITHQVGTAEIFRFIYAKGTESEVQ